MGYELGSLCWDILGAHARPIQVTATSPISALLAKEFVATGWGVGCPSDDTYGEQCSGTEGPNNSFRERQYFDGRTGLFGYFIYWHGDVNQGELPEFRVQRGSGYSCSYSGTGTCFFWDAFKNSSVVDGSSGFAMSKGWANFGSESAYAGTNLVMTKDSTWSFMQKRVTSWSNVDSAIEFEPHSPSCYLTLGYGGVWGGYYSDGSGSC